MNSKDENGKYIFAGSKGDTAPFSRNSDGTYSYNGDQVTLDLPVGDTMSMATNSTGWEVFQQAINTSRSQITLTAPAVIDDGVCSAVNGQVSSEVHLQQLNSAAASLTQSISSAARSSRLPTRKATT